MDFLELFDFALIILRDSGFDAFDRGDVTILLLQVEFVLALEILNFSFVLCFEGLSGPFLGFELSLEVSELLCDFSAFVGDFSVGRGRLVLPNSVDFLLLGGFESFEFSFLG